MKNWKTTTLGILTIVGALSTAGVQYLKSLPVDYTAILTAITAGVGLITARDSKPTDLTPDQASTVKAAVNSGAIPPK